MMGEGKIRRNDPAAQGKLSSAVTTHNHPLQARVRVCVFVLSGSILWMHICRRKFNDYLRGAIRTLNRYVRRVFIMAMHACHEAIHYTFMRYT